MSTERLFLFKEYFARDLESWFSAEIACCDHCRDDFLSLWPHADAADNFYFQTKSIDADSFYLGGRLQDYFTKTEFDSLIQELSCPRCFAPLGGNMWAYELPFNVPPDFESTIEEVSNLAKATPFLLLEHKFCNQVLSSIRAAYKSTSDQNISETLFRARSLTHGSIDEEIENFEAPPRRYIQEGRYNHAGNPVLYLASDADTCQAELRGDACLILELKLNYQLRILDLINPFGAHDECADLLNSLVYSALVSARQQSNGWEKPHYIVSRFVADCARAAGFDAIKYPSTRITSKNFNLVIINQAFKLKEFANVVRYHRLSAAAAKV